MRGLILAIASAALIVGGAYWFLQQTAPTQVVISTGAPSGIYYRVGQQIGKSFEGAGGSTTAVKCLVKKSGGSAENIARLEDGTADVAIVQNDAIASGRVRSLAMLYTETLHLICRRDKKIRCLNDLVEFQTNLGSRSSGTNQLVKELLSFSRVSLPQKTQHNVGFSEAESMLAAGELDAAFFLVGVGAEVIARLLADERFDLVPIKIRVDGREDELVSEKAFIDGFRTHYPYATYAEIPLMAYEGKPKRPTPTVGIGAVLVCREDWDDQLAKDLVMTTFAQKAVLGREISLLSGLDESTNQSALQFPLHLGAEAYYRRNEPGYLAENAESIGLLITLALLVASGMHAVKKWIVQRRKNRVDVYYQRVQEIQSAAISACSDTGLAVDWYDEAYYALREIESKACEELISERLDADHAYLILQNMISRCRAELEHGSAERRSELPKDDGGSSQANAT